MTFPDQQQQTTLAQCPDPANHRPPRCGGGCRRGEVWPCGGDEPVAVHTADQGVPQLPQLILLLCCGGDVAGVLVEQRPGPIPVAHPLAALRRGRQCLPGRIRIGHPVLRRHATATFPDQQQQTTLAQCPDPYIHRRPRCGGGCRRGEGSLADGDESVAIRVHMVDQGVPQLPQLIRLLRYGGEVAGVLVEQRPGPIRV
ncbi:hypothetical protein ABGB16_33695, partial [Micromonospora sp. B11E3]